MRRTDVLMLACGLLLFSACQRSEQPGRPGGEKKVLRIAVIPKGMTLEFWRSVHAGAIKASREFLSRGTAVEIIWKGPIREDDREQQVQVVESFTSQGVDGIVLAALDRKALVRPVEDAKRMNIPVVEMDSALDSDAIVSFVATDNVRGGEMAADEMGRQLGGKGKVILLRYAEGSASTGDRETGFLNRLKSNWHEIQVISSDQYAGTTRETAKRASENLLNRLGHEVHGIFTPNEGSTFGMLLALQDLGKAGQVVLLGFDATEVFVDAIRKGQLHGIIVQNPLRMGYLAVKTMVEHLLGNAVEKRIDTGALVVTRDNLDSPEARELLYPPLKEYLNP